MKNYLQYKLPHLRKKPKNTRALLVNSKRKIIRYIFFGFNTDRIREETTIYGDSTNIFEIGIN